MIVVNGPASALAGVDRSYIETEAKRARSELARRRLCLHDRAALPVQGAAAIVVDDGIATGAGGHDRGVAIRSRRIRVPECAR